MIRYRSEILMMAWPRQWNGVEAIPPTTIPGELKGPAPPGPGGGGHDENG